MELSNSNDSNDLLLTQMPVLPMKCEKCELMAFHIVELPNS